MSQEQMSGSDVLPRVTVVGSGTEADPVRAFALGHALAKMGVHLITGGGAGNMAEVARGFTGVRTRAGRSIGILPARSRSSDGRPEPPEAYPNPWVEIPIFTHLVRRGAEGAGPESRNHLVVLSGEVVVALPGSQGTLSEVELALEYGRPVTAHMDDPEELPGMPGSVPLLPELTRVLDFVREGLEGRINRGG